MSLTSLNEYLVLLICFELPVVDIYSLRQSCRSLCKATRAKILWIYILERQTREEGKVLPPYMRGYDLLDSFALGALACRVARLDFKCETGTLSPVRDWRLHLPQSITWLRLFSGTWLFVVSSDNHISKISCWDLTSVFQGRREPLAQAYLPGQVKTGKLEVQDSGVVLALGLGAESLAVHVITLRKHSGGYVFSELCRVDGSSHVLMLCGDLVGCGLRNGAIQPHIVNWKDDWIDDIPELDIPGRRRLERSHVMTICKNALVVVRKNALQVYTLRSNAGDSIALVKLVEIPTVWKVAVCSLSSESFPDPSLRLIVLSPIGVEMCIVNLDVLTELDDQPLCRRFTLAKSPRYYYHDEPWYRLCVGETGRRNVLISAAEEGFSSGPHLIYTTVPSHPSEDCEAPVIIWSNDDPDQPALWALPLLDIDEALGLTVIGNCFGELAIYDHVGKHPEKCCGLAPDFSDQQNPISSIMPTLPISLGLSVAPPSAAETSFEFRPSMVLGWSQDEIDLGQIWRADWNARYSIPYIDCDAWQGVLCDYAWLLEHGYGFPGSVIPQAYMNDDDYGFQRLLFRLGDRYFVFSAFAEPDERLRSWPVFPSARNRFFLPSEAEPESYIRRPAKAESNMYKQLLRTEMRERRNRWIEQAERGGRPHENLLLMPPILDPDSLLD